MLNTAISISGGHSASVVEHTRYNSSRFRRQLKQPAAPLAAWKDPALMIFSSDVRDGRDRPAGGKALGGRQHLCRPGRAHVTTNVPAASICAGDFTKAWTLSAPAHVRQAQSELDRPSKCSRFHLRPQRGRETKMETKGVQREGNEERFLPPRFPGSLRAPS